MSHQSARVREAAARSLSARVLAIPTRAPASAPALLLRVAAASRRRDDDGSVKDPNTEDDHGYYGSSVNDDNIPHEVASARALLETLRAAASGAAHPLGAPVALKTLAPLVAASGAFYTLVPIRPRGRGERRSLRTFAGVSLRPGSLAFNPRPRRLSTPSDAFKLHPDFALYGTTLSGDFPFAASGAIDGKLVCWDLNTLQPRNTLQHGGAVSALRWIPGTACLYRCERAKRRRRRRRSHRRRRRRRSAFFFLSLFALLVTFRSAPRPKQRKGLARLPVPARRWT